MTKKILVADGDILVNAFLKELLKDEGYDVFSAFDGFGAVQLARTVEPDLIVLDLNLPAGGGETAYERLRMIKFTKEIPVFIITGSSAERRKKFVEAKNVPPENVFLKPLDTPKFLYEVKRRLIKNGE